MKKIVFALNLLLLFLLVFEEKIRLSVVFEAIGRGHLLLVHFPIVGTFLLAIGLLFFKKSRFDAAFFQKAVSWNALAVVLSALAGLFLSREGGYPAETLFEHKISGLVLSLACWAVIEFWSHLIHNQWIARVSGSLFLAILIFCGHHGGVLTHGAGFISEPFKTGNSTAERRAPGLDTAFVFRDLVQPLLIEKCGSCHNPTRQKGQFSIETAREIALGGKNGLVIDTLDSEKSELWKRLLLPSADEKRMPPADRPQLSADELALLHFWLKNGATGVFKNDFVGSKNGTVADTLARFHAAFFGKKRPDEFADIRPASQSDIEKLASFYCSIRPVFRGSGALEVALLNHAHFSNDIFQKLQSIENQVVELDCRALPIGDDEARVVSKFKNLHRLDFSETDLTDAGLAQFASLKKLRRLHLFGTRITAAGLSVFEKMPALEAVVLPESILKSDREALASRFGTVLFTGSAEAASATGVQLSKPEVEWAHVFFHDTTHVVLSHPIRSAHIVFTTDGSEPDSSSRVFDSLLVIENQGVVKFRAFREGWLPSDMDSLEFQKTGRRPDSWRLLVPSNPQYRGQGKAGLFDGKKAKLAFRDDGWMGFREEDFVLECRFDQPTSFSSVALSQVLTTRSWIMPPAIIEIWGGDSPDNLQKIGQRRFAPPSAHVPDQARFFSCPVAKKAVKYLKIRALPIRKLPGWHEGKGQPAWIFVDEVILN